MPTPNLGLPTLAQGQAQKEIAHNEALLRLDALVQTCVKSRALATPPGGPANGDCWIVPSGATFVWTGQSDKIAFWREGAWALVVPVVGWRVHVEDERLTVVWTDDAWRDRIVGTANGGAIRLVALEWAAFSTSVPKGAAALGDVLVFKRQGGGHVGLYVGHDGSTFHVLGGNQSDRVTLCRLSKQRLVAVRRPAYRAQPANVRPIALAASGSLSVSEA